MTRSKKHPSASQLAGLTAGGLRPRRAARIEAHIARCGQCTQVSQQLNAIAAKLARASYPPMPEYLSVRIRAAISREAQQRLAAMAATTSGRRDLPGLPIAAIRLAAAVGAVVIAAAGSYLVAANAGTSVTRAQSSPLAGAAAPAQHMSPGPYVTYGQPGSLDTIRAVQSHTNFAAARLRTQAISALKAAEALGDFTAQSSASTAARLTRSAAEPVAGGPSSSRLAGCVGLIAPGRTVLLIDIARYQGNPAAVIVTAATVVGEAEAWVVGSSCSATTKDVLTRAALGT